MGVQQALGGKKGKVGLMMLQTTPRLCSEPGTATADTPAVTVPSSPGDSIGVAGADVTPNPSQGTQPVPALPVSTWRRRGHPQGLGDTAVLAQPRWPPDRGDLLSQGSGARASASSSIET